MKADADSVRLAYVLADNIDGLWPIIEPILARAFEKHPSELTTDIVREKAKAKELCVWVGHSGDVSNDIFMVAVSGVKTIAGVKTVEIFALSGDQGQSG